MLRPAHSKDDRRRRTTRTGLVKQAILARVISLRRQCADFVAVRLESEALNDATGIVSTGLACERMHMKSPCSSLDVLCKGDPRAAVGDTVPVVVESEDKECVRRAISSQAGTPALHVT